MCVLFIIRKRIGGRWFIGRYGVDGKGYPIELDESLIQEDFLFGWSFSAILWSFSATSIDFTSCCILFL